MSVSYNKFQCFVQDVGRKVHNLHTDTLKVYLSNAAPSASSHTVKADIAEISAGNGYTAGGEDTQNTYSQSGGTASLVGTDVTWTASGGSIGAFRYVILYNDDSTSDSLIGWWDYGSSITIQDGESFTTDFSSTIATLV